MEENELHNHKFTAHNIVLDDGSQTYPESSLRSMSEHPLFQSSKRLLDFIFPGSKTDLNLIDLACLEGGFTVEFARLGFKSLGIEVRNSNFVNCEYVKNHVNIPHLKFIQDNVLNLERYGSFDVVFCSGILYHLEKPKAFLEMMEKCCNKVLIVNTHYSTDVKNTKFNLSDEIINEDLPGRWYFEHDEISIEQLDQMKWASWENNKSFWIRREYLIQAIRDVGFDIVFEQYDGINNGINIGDEMTSDEFNLLSRGTFVGLKC